MNSDPNIASQLQVSNLEFGNSFDPDFNNNHAESIVTMIANRVALRTCSLRNTFSRRVPRRNYASHDPDATTAAPPIASSSRKPLPLYEKRNAIEVVQQLIKVVSLLVE